MEDKNKPLSTSERKLILAEMQKKILDGIKRPETNNDFNQFLEESDKVIESKIKYNKLGQLWKTIDNTLKALYQIPLEKSTLILQKTNKFNNLVNSTYDFIESNDLSIRQLEITVGKISQLEKLIKDKS